MTRTGTTSGSRWGKGGGGGGRGDQDSDSSWVSSAASSSGLGWVGQAGHLPAPRRPIWASQLDRSRTPSDKMVNFRDHSKEELDRLSDSKSILENNKKSFLTSPPGLVPPFGILIHQVGNVLKPTLSYRAGGPLSEGSEGQSPEGGGGHDLQGREGPHRSGNGLCHPGKTYSKSYLTMSHLG